VKSVRPAVLVGIAFWLGRVVGSEPLLPPSPSPWDAPLRAPEINRLPVLDDFRALLRGRGTFPRGYFLRRVSPDQPLPALGPGGFPQLYVAEDSGGSLRAARLTISVEDFRTLVDRLPNER
jgi:hypothetical protein